MKNKSYEKPKIKITRLDALDIITASSVDADYSGAKGNFDSEWLKPSYSTGADYSGAKGKFDKLW